MKQNSLGGVQILWFAITHSAAAKADGPTSRITNREHDAVSKTVIVFAVILTNNEPRGEQSFCSFFRFSKLVEYVAPAVGCKTDAEALRRRAVDATFLQIFDRLRGFLEAGLPVSCDGVHQ